MSDLPPPQIDNHAFNPIFAAYYGVDEAILITHFQHWINTNMAKGSNKIEGRTWTYQTRKDISARYIYYTEKQVRRIVDSLVEKGVLIKANFNKKGFDKTNWYAFKNEEIFTLAQMGRPLAQMGRPSAQTGQPIPYTNPYTNPYAKEHMHAEHENCQDAFFQNENEFDEMGNKQFKDFELKGKAREAYQSLSNDQKKSFHMLMNVEPASNEDSRFNVVAALKLAVKYYPGTIKDSITVYQQRIKRGDKVKVMGAYLTNIIKKGIQPEPEHAEENKKHWKEVKNKFQPHHYTETKNEVKFEIYPGRIIAFTMCAKTFREQIEMSYCDMKNNIK